MNDQALLQLLERIKSGQLSPAEAEQELRAGRVADLGFARIDLERQRRQGAAEVVYGEGKTSEQLLGILDALLLAGQNVMVTRVDSAKAREVCAERPQVQYRTQARVLVGLSQAVVVRDCPAVALVTAGTSDIPIAEEAAEMLALLGVPVDRIYDVGVAGLHRLLNEIERVRLASAVIVVAGMEGALASVVGGLVRGPVVAVPSSVGYGAALSGWTALLGMLTSCASGVVVVNIDNGFGAAMAVHRLLERPA